ncbi:MAG: HlyD family type I secretion periplasmic adaptor subunit [Pseudomonadota bacterium]
MASADGAAAAAIAGGEADASAAALARIIPKKAPADQARSGASPQGAPTARPAPDGPLPAPAGKAAPAPAPSGGDGAKPPALPGLALAGGAPPPSPVAAAAARFSAGRSLTLGFLGVLVLVAGLFGWGAFANIAGAIIAPGQVEVETRDQVVEHPDGGVVGAILVKDGDRVAAGDVLLRFDDTLLRSEETILQEQLWELTAWRNRLQAETFGAEEIAFDPLLTEAAAVEPYLSELLEEQRLLYQTRIRSEAEQVQQLRERQAQTEQQIAGAESQIEALERQLDFISEELTGLRQLFAQGLAQLNRVLSLQREEARLAGEVGELTANIAQARGQLAEIEIQILQLQTQRQERAIDESRRLQYEASGIREQLAAVRERLSRMEVRAPVAGTVFNNTVFAERSVVGPGEPIMFVVPEDVEFIISAQVELMHIDAVYPGQEAALRFSAFSMRTTPELNGHVVRVSADAVQDERTGMSFYTAELALDDGEADKLEGLTLLPGMPVEAYIRTEDRTPLNYLVKPLTDYFSRSMREE